MLSALATGAVLRQTAITIDQKRRHDKWKVAVPYLSVMRGRLSLREVPRDAGRRSNLLLVARNPKEIASPAIQRGRNDTFSSSPSPPCK